MGDSSLIIRIGADASGVRKGVEEATVTLKGLGASTISVAHDFVELAEKAVAAGKALGDLFLGNALETIDAQAKLARNIGSSIDGLRGLQLYAKDAGISEEGLAAATAKLNQTVGQGLNGNEKANAALRQLYLNAKDLQGLDADQKMAVLADAIKAAGLSTEQTLAALKDLGIKGGTELVDAMRNGGDAIRAARKEVDDFGLSLSKVDAAKVEAANDAMDRIHLAMEAIQNRIAIALAPIIKALADRFNELSKSTGGFKTIADAAVNGLITGAKILADALYAIRVVWLGIELAISAVAAAVMSVINTVVQLGATLYDAVAVPINGWIKIANQFGANIAEIGKAVGGDFAMGMSAATAAVDQNVVDTYNKLSALVSQPLPSTAIDEFVAKARAAAQSVAEAQTGSEPGNGSTDFLAEQLTHQQEAHKLQIDEDAIFKQTLLDQQATFEQSMQALQIKGTTSGVTLSDQLKTQQISDVGEMATKVLAQYSTHSKKMFDLNKAVNIGMAIMNTFKGVSESLAAYPMPLAAVMAALHLASGMANVASIRSQQFGSTSSSGGGSSSSSSATAASTATGNGATGSSNTLMVQGIDSNQLYSGSMVRSLAERLSQFTADGGKLVIA